MSITSKQFELIKMYNKNMSMKPGCVSAALRLSASEPSPRPYRLLPPSGRGAGCGPSSPSGPQWSAQTRRGGPLGQTHSPSLCPRWCATPGARQTLPHQTGPTAAANSLSVVMWLRRYTQCWYVFVAVVLLNKYCVCVIFCWSKII